MQGKRAPGVVIWPQGHLQQIPVAIVLNRGPAMDAVKIGTQVEE